MNTNWYLRSRRHYFLDFHVDDWNEEFLSKFDPEEYAEECYKSGATAATFMANTHSGKLNYPTKLGGTIHQSLVQKIRPREIAGGRQNNIFEDSGSNIQYRDILKETIDALHKRGLDAIVYYVFVYVVDYWDKHPSARSRFADGTVIKQSVGTREREHRFATCCFNDPGYRKQSLSELEEICRNYDFEGIWPDMTFWPTVCYCSNCKERYLKETGKRIPEVINWKNPEFVQFIRTRQRWLVEFDSEITDIIRKFKPGMKYAQQSQTFVWDWMAGASPELADCWDWMSADLYSNRYGLSYSSKFFYALSSMKPFERVNCWNYPNIHEHSVTRTENELKEIAYSTMMNDGALTVIDQVNPNGTIHTKNYQLMKNVFSEIEKYEPYLGGEFKADVGIYYSFYSNFDQDWNGRRVEEAGFTLDPSKWSSLSETTHMAASESVAKTFTIFHVPYGVVTKKNLNDLCNYKVIVLANVAMMDDKERDAIRGFVRNGGRIYASKETSEIDADGYFQKSFLLEDLFGVKLVGKTSECTTYISPSHSGQRYFPEVYTAEFPVSVKDSQTIVSTDIDETERSKNSDEITVLATQTLPYEYPSEERYASLLTTPPGRFTDRPAVTVHRYGKGLVMYSTAELETGDHISQREIFFNLIHSLFDDYTTKLTGYPTVEITRFEKNSPDTTIIHINNYQNDLPNLPIYDLVFNVKMYGKQADRVTDVLSGEQIPFIRGNDDIRITVPKLQDYRVLSIRYIGDR